MVARHYQQSSIKDNKSIEYFPFYDIVTNTGYSNNTEVLDIIYTKFQYFLSVMDILKRLNHEQLYIITKEGQ